MERDVLTEVMSRYNEDRSHFGKGPTRPHKTGHCSNEPCGDAVGVRVWFRYERTLDTELSDKYIHDIWWTGEGCIYCLGAAAAIVPKLLGLKMTSDGTAVQTIIDVRNEFADLSESERLCTDTAILAFVRAIFHQFYTKTDWTEEDLDGFMTPSDELDIFCCDEQIVCGKRFDNGDLYEC